MKKCIKNNLIHLSVSLLIFSIYFKLLNSSKIYTRFQKNILYKCISDCKYIVFDASDMLFNSKVEIKVALIDKK